jgi:hypothetical protein
MVLGTICTSMELALAWLGHPSHILVTPHSDPDYQTLHRPIVWATNQVLCSLLNGEETSDFQISTLF